MSWYVIFEKLILRGINWLIRNKGLADVDHDGDVDFDDLWATYLNVKAVLATAAEHFDDWDTMTRGQKIDAVVEYIKGQGATVKGCVIAALETVAYVVLWCTGQTK